MMQVNKWLQSVVEVDPNDRRSNIHITKQRIAVVWMLEFVGHSV